MHRYHVLQKTAVNTFLFLTIRGELLQLNNMDVTAIILAGGKSSRMGRDKGLVLYRGKRMVEHVVEACKKLTSDILISTNNPEYSFLGYRLIPDDYKNTGPIGGMLAALKASATEDNIFCPCDMPNLHPGILQKIITKSDGESVVVAVDPTGKIYPVLGYYKKSVLPAIETQIKKGDFKLQHLLAAVNAKKVEVKDAKALSNVNYPKDLK